MIRTTQGYWCLAVAALLAIALMLRPNLQAQGPAIQRSSAPPTSPILVTHTTETPTGQQLTVIDSGRHVMAVYMIEKGTGRVTLKSVRQLHWDLQLEEFNGVSPTPREIQSLLSR